MPNREFSSGINMRFLGREALSGATADGVAGVAVDTLDHDTGVAFYIMAEVFTSGQLDFSVETADDAGFTQNVETLTRDHYVEQPVLPVNLAAAQTPGLGSAIKIGVTSTRKFVRLRRSAAAFAGTVIYAAGMKPDIKPEGTLSNQQ